MGPSPLRDHMDKGGNGQSMGPRKPFFRCLLTHWALFICFLSLTLLPPSSPVSSH